MTASITFEELIPEVRRRLLEYGENAPFGDQYISEKPTYNQIGWTHKPDAMSQILSEYGESCALEKTFRLESMTKQFNAEIAAIQDVLVERLGSDIHRRRGSAVLAWENIALPIREVEGNIIRIFPSGDICGKPIYDVMPCDRFIRWVGQRAVNDSMARKKSERRISFLMIACIILAVISISLGSYQASCERARHMLAKTALSHGDPLIARDNADDDVFFNDTPEPP